MAISLQLTSWLTPVLYLLATLALLLLSWGAAKLIQWAKKRRAGAFMILAFFPLLSLFPIPPAEIKKLQRVQQEQPKRQQESGDPAKDEAAK